MASTKASSMPCHASRSGVPSIKQNPRSRQNVLTLLLSKRRDGQCRDSAMWLHERKTFDGSVAQNKSLRKALPPAKPCTSRARFPKLAMYFERWIVLTIGRDRATQVDNLAYTPRSGCAGSTSIASMSARASVGTAGAATDVAAGPAAQEYMHRMLCIALLLCCTCCSSATASAAP